MFTDHLKMPTHPNSHHLDESIPSAFRFPGTGVTNSRLADAVVAFEWFITRFERSLSAIVNGRGTPDSYFL